MASRGRLNVVPLEVGKLLSAIWNVVQGAIFDRRNMRHHYQKKGKLEIRAEKLTSTAFDSRFCARRNNAINIPTDLLMNFAVVPKMGVRLPAVQ